MLAEGTQERTEAGSCRGGSSDASSRASFRAATSVAGLAAAGEWCTDTVLATTATLTWGSGRSTKASAGGQRNDWWPRCSGFSRPVALQ